jgi:lysophospholipase L1-like esterase
LSIALRQSYTPPISAPLDKGCVLRRLRWLLSRVLLVCIGVLGPLCVIEAGVRLLGIAPPAQLQPALWAPHPYLGWFHPPNRAGSVSSEYREFDAFVRINARGLRDREIGYDNPARAVRILALGDSFVEALQVPLETTFTHQLETLLTSDEQPVEVINAGVGGWGTDQEAIFFAIEGFRYQPAVVLLFFFPHNDVMNNYQPLESARLHGIINKPFFHLDDGRLIEPTFPFEPSEGRDQPATPLLSAGEWLNAHVATYRLVAPYVREIPGLGRALAATGILGSMAAFMAADPDAPPIAYGLYQAQLSAEWEAAWQLTEAIILRLDAEVRSRGARLGVVVIGAPEQVYPDRWAATLSRYPDMSAADYDLDAPNRRLSAFLADANIAHLDLLPVFRQAATAPDAPPLYYRHDGHWTPAGHQLVATTVAGFVRSLIETAP